MRSPMRFVAAAALLLAPALSGAQTTIYSNDFESGSAGPAFSGAGEVFTTGGLSAFGFGANHLYNGTPDPTVLSLTGIGSHTSMTLSFYLAMWDSIDEGSDFLHIMVDGSPVFVGTFGNYFPTTNCVGPGTVLTPDFTGFATPDYGMSASYRDCARSVSFTFAHTASSATISWAYPFTQGAADESFGIDNVVVQIDAASTTVPEPGSLALLTAGLVGVAFVRRRYAR